MRKITAYLKRIRIYWQRSPQTEKILLGVIGLCLVALVVLGLTVSDARTRAAEAAARAAELEQENARLEDNIEALGSAEGVEQIARDELDLVDPDTTVVIPEE